MRGLPRRVVVALIALPLSACLLAGCGPSKEEVKKQDEEGRRLNEEMMNRMIQQQGNIGGTNQGPGTDPGTEVTRDPGASPMPGQGGMAPPGTPGQGMPMPGQPGGAAGMPEAQPGK